MESTRPVQWPEVVLWVEVAHLAAKRGLQLQITHDPERENPWVRLVG